MLTYARKALAAGILAALAALGAVMLDGDLTTAEAIASAGAGLVAAGGTYVVPNATARHRG